MDHQKFNYTTTHGLTITAILGDITKQTADAVVTGDGCYLDGEGRVTIALQSVIPNIRDVRRRLRAECGQLDLWTVQSSPLGFRFKYVIFAILTKGSGESWVKHMNTLYKRIFEEADRLKIHVTALPLLGAGKAETERSLSIQAFVTSALQYRPRYLRDINIVIKNSEVLDMIHTQIVFEKSGISEPCEEMFSALSGGLKSCLSPPIGDKQQQTARNNCSTTHQPWHGESQRNLQGRASQAVSDNTCQLKNTGRSENTNRKQNHLQEAMLEEQRQLEMALQMSRQEAGNRKYHQYLNHSVSRGEDAELQIASQRSREEAAARGFDTDPGHSISGNKNKSNRRDNEEHTFAGVRSSDTEAECRICMVNPVDCVFVSCGHMMSCLRCAENLSSCPVCRRSIERALKVYKS